jgi:hypothetical protein
VSNLKAEYLVKLRVFNCVLLHIAFNVISKQNQIDPNDKGIKISKNVVIIFCNIAGIWT